MWLCVAAKSLQLPSGRFFQGKGECLSLVLFIDREAVPEHLPLAQSYSTDAEEATLMTRLEELKTK